MQDPTGELKPTELNAGSGLNVDIRFDDQGQVETVKVDGQSIAVQPQPAEPASGGSGDEFQNVFFEWIDPLLQAGANLWQRFVEHLPFLLAAIACLIITALVAHYGRKITLRLLRDTGLRSSLQKLFAYLLYLLVWITGAIAAITIIVPDLEVGRTLTVLGVASLLAGFLFRDILENLFAGVMILWRFPFEEGDYIEIKPEDHDLIRGQVHDIWIRMTLIREISDELITVPNAKIYQNPERIMTWRGARRMTCEIGIAFSEDIGKARKVLCQAIANCETCDGNQKVQVFASRIDNSAVIFELAWWTKPEPLAMLASRDEVIEAAKSALDKAEIEIPFPHRSLLFKEALPYERVDRDDTESADESDGGEPSDRSEDES